MCEKLSVCERRGKEGQNQAGKCKGWGNQMREPGRLCEGGEKSAHERRDAGVGMHGERGNVL